jgi:hypothetical protein
MPLDAKKQYVEVRWLNEQLAELGYAEEFVGDGHIHYVQKKQDEVHLPGRLTISYPVVGIDGSLWYEKGYVFDLFDRLSDIDPGEEVIIRAIRKLDS